MSWMTVLFPEPLAPTSAICVPGSTSRERPRITFTPGLVGYWNWTFSSLIWPWVLEASTVLPSVDSASILGLESRSRVILDAESWADDISGTKVKRLPAWMTPHVEPWKSSLPLEKAIEKWNAHHNANIKLESRVFSEWPQPSAIPEHEWNNEECHSLGEWEQCTAMDHGPTRSVYRFVEALAIQGATLILPG